MVRFGAVMGSSGGEGWLCDGGGAFSGAGETGSALEFEGAEHGPTAIGGSAVAVGGGVVRVVEVVLVGELFPAWMGRRVEM